MKVFLIILLAALLFAVGYIVYVNVSIKTVRFEKKNKKIPESFDGVKIIFLSDLHDSFLFGNGKKRLFSKIRAEKPDYIFLGGDMHEKEKFDEAYFSFLEKLENIAPLYYVDGNHEDHIKKRENPETYFEKFEKFVRHINKMTVLKRKDSEISLYGRDYFSYKKGELSFNEDDFSIFLFHSPFMFDDFSPRPDLMLSGHVHGGIFDLPYIGAVFAPGDGLPLYKRFHRRYFFPKYYKGAYEKDGKTLIVSRGLGAFKICPIRFLKPEIILVTLKHDGKSK